MFRRDLALGAVVCALAASGMGSALVLARLVGGLTAAAAAGTLLALLLVAAVARSRRRARRTEIVRSFAGLTVLHHGAAILVDRAPFLGEFATRREAAWAAARCGRWAIIVRAYGRYYVLTGDTAPAEHPVSFRSRAVADVVPAFFDSAIPA